MAVTDYKLATSRCSSFRIWNPQWKSQSLPLSGGY